MTKTLLELDADDCKFPVGLPETTGSGEQQFCASSRVAGKPYYLACCVVAYVLTRPANVQRILA